MGAAGIDPDLWLQHAWRNRLQSLVLLTAMAGYLALLGWLLWGGDGIVMLLALGAFATVLNPRISPGLVMRLYGATPIHPHAAPWLWDAVSALSVRARLPSRPHLHYVPSRIINAFAAGSPEHSAIAVTDGLLRRLSPRELVGVLAHEISHIRNNDLWVMGLADLFSRATSALSLLGQLLLLLNLPLLLLGGTVISWWAVLLLVFAPTLSAITQLALSRTREYDADLNAARLTGDPEGLASALARIERIQGGWLERMFMPGRGSPEPSLLRTHPETRNRIERLQALRLRRDRPATLIPGGYDVDAIGGPVTRRPRRHFNGFWY